MIRRTHWASTIALAIVLAACTSSVSSSTTSLLETTTIPPTSSTTSTTTPATTTTTTPEPETTTLVLVVYPPTTVMTPTGIVPVEGHVNRPATVTIEGTEVDTYSNPDGQTHFQEELQLGPGDHLIEVEAIAAGVSAKGMLRVVVDPSLVRQFAYITAVDPVAGTVTADYAEWYVGEEAETAAVEDGMANPDGTIDGGFYIRNQNDRLRILPIASVSDTEIVLVVCYPGPGPCIARDLMNLAEMAEAMADPESTVETHGWHWYGANMAPMWLTLDDHGTIVQIEEQYLP